MSQVQLNTPVRSKVKSITQDGTWVPKSGPGAGTTFYKFAYEMEDGVSITANHKASTSPFKIGDEVEYTVKRQNQYGNGGSVVGIEEPAQTSSGGNSRGWKPKSIEDLKNEQLAKNPSMAMSYAKDLHCAHGYSNGDIEKQIDELKYTANEILSWLNDATSKIS